MNNLEAAICLILSKDGDRDLDAGSNLTVEESMAIVGCTQPKIRKAIGKLKERIAPNR
jgi:hypothetical protein